MIKYVHTIKIWQKLDMYEIYTRTQTHMYTHSVESLQVTHSSFRTSD